MDLKNGKSLVKNFKNMNENHVRRLDIEFRFLQLIVSTFNLQFN